MVYLAKPNASSASSPPLMSPRGGGNDDELSGKRRRLSQRSRVLSPNVILQGLAEREGLAVAYIAPSQRRLDTIQTAFSSILIAREATILSTGPKEERATNFHLPGWRKGVAHWQFATDPACARNADVVVFDNYPVEEIDRLLPALHPKGGRHILVLLAPEDPQHWERLSHYYQARSKDYDITYIS